MTGTTDAESITVYISIGNSDDKLTHAEWAEFHSLTHELLTEATSHVYGAWHSLPARPHQNACWAVEVPTDHVTILRVALSKLAAKFRQDSIAWAEARTEFVTPSDEAQEVSR